MTSQPPLLATVLAVQPAPRAHRRPANRRYCAAGCGKRMHPRERRICVACRKARKEGKDRKDGKSARIPITARRSPIAG